MAVTFPFMAPDRAAGATLVQPSQSYRPCCYWFLEKLREIIMAGMTAMPFKCILAIDRLEFFGRMLSNGSTGL